MASWLVEAAWGSHTAPTEQVAATMPPRVSMPLARTAARSRAGDHGDFTLAAILEETPNLLPAVRPMTSLPRKVRARRSPTATITSSPASKPKPSLIIARRSIEATRKAQWRLSALARSMAWDSSSRKRIAVEMAGQFVAGGQIGQAAHFARTLGGVAHQPDQPRGAPIVVRHARAGHGEIAPRPWRWRFRYPARKKPEVGIARFQHRLQLARGVPARMPSRKTARRWR